MEKTIFKLTDIIAKKHNSSLIEVVMVFLANIVSGNDFENTIKKLFSLDEKEKEVLYSLFEILKDDSLKNKTKIINELSNYFDEKSYDYFLYFFVPFLSNEGLLSQDAEKIRKDLQHYPKEISEGMIKALEMLSLAKKLDNKEILKEILNTIFILKGVFRLIGGNNEIR